MPRCLALDRSRFQPIQHYPYLGGHTHNFQLPRQWNFLTIQKSILKYTKRSVTMQVRYDKPGSITTQEPKVSQSRYQTGVNFCRICLVNDKHEACVNHSWLILQHCITRRTETSSIITHTIYSTVQHVGTGPVLQKRSRKKAGLKTWLPCTVHQSIQDTSLERPSSFEPRRTLQSQRPMYLGSRIMRCQDCE